MNAAAAACVGFVAGGIVFTILYGLTHSAAMADQQAKRSALRQRMVQIKQMTGPGASWPDDRQALSRVQSLAAGAVDYDDR